MTSKKSFISSADDRSRASLTKSFISSADGRSRASLSKSFIRSADGRSRASLSKLFVSGRIVSTCCVKISQLSAISVQAHLEQGAHSRNVQSVNSPQKKKHKSHGR